MHSGTWHKPEQQDEEIARSSEADAAVEGKRQSVLRFVFVEVEGDARSVASAMRHAANLIAGENTDEI